MGAIGAKGAGEGLWVAKMVSGKGFAKKRDKRRKNDDEPPTLTPGDIEMLRKLAAGEQLKETDGGRNRMIRVRHIMGARTTTQAVVMAVKKGFI